MSKQDTIQPYDGEVNEDFSRWLDDSREKLAVENWREIGINPAFQNSWIDAGANPAFYKDPFRRVHLKGDLSTGASGTVAFTLPEGYRPSEALNFALWQTGGAAGAYAVIATTGTVTIVRTAATVSLNAVSFRV